MFILYIVYMLPKNCLVKLGYICIYMCKFSQNVTSLQLEFEYD